MSKDKIIADCKELIKSLSDYNRSYDHLNEKDEEISYLHEWAEELKYKLEDFSYCLSSKD